MLVTSTWVHRLHTASRPLRITDFSKVRSLDTISLPSILLIENSSLEKPAKLHHPWWLDTAENRIFIDDHRVVLYRADVARKSQVLRLLFKDVPMRMGLYLFTGDRQNPRIPLRVESPFKAAYSTLSEKKRLIDVRLRMCSPAKPNHWVIVETGDFTGSPVGKKTPTDYQYADIQRPGRRVRLLFGDSPEKSFRLGALLKVEGLRQETMLTFRPPPDWFKAKGYEYFHHPAFHEQDFEYVELRADEK